METEIQISEMTEARRAAYRQTGLDTLRALFGDDTSVKDGNEQEIIAFGKMVEELGLRAIESVK